MRKRSQRFDGQDWERSTKYFESHLKSSNYILDVPIITPSGHNLTSGKYINFFQEIIKPNEKKFEYEQR